MIYLGAGRIEKEDHTESIPDVFWKTNDSSVSGQKGKGYSRQRW